MKELLIMAKSLGGGGSEVALIELINALPEEHYNVTLVLLDLDSEYISNIRMHDIMAINVALITGKVIFDKTPYVLYRQHGNNVLGYSHKKIQIGKWIKEKLKLIRNKEDYSTAEYAKTVLNVFESQMNENEKKEYKLISNMNESLISRLKVLTRPYTKEEFGRTSISIRFKILLNLM